MRLADLPNNPQIGESYQVESMTFTWNGTVWEHKYEVYPEDDGTDRPRNPYAQT
jgi:hypothetical protein